MKILAVETATEACSAALYIDGEIAEKYQRAPKEHSRLILPMVDSLFAEASLKITEIDAIAFGCGPGSFTGVRIATGIAQGIAFAVDLPVLPVSTLAALAQECFDKQGAQRAFAAMDARMGEIYWAEYRKNSQGYAELIGKEQVTAASNISFSGKSGYGVGSGWRIYQTELTQILQECVTKYDASSLPRAACIARLAALGMSLGMAVSAEQAMPVYLRNKVAKKQSER